MGRKRKLITVEDKKAAKKLANKKHRCKKKGPMQIASCNTCRCNVDTMMLKSQANKELHSLLATHSSSTSFEWPDEIAEHIILETVINALFPDGVVPAQVRNDPKFFATVLPPVRLRTVTVPHKSFTTKQMKALKGGKIEKGHAFDPKTVLSNPADGTIGLVILQSESGENRDADFVFVCSSALENEHTVKIAEEEDPAIKGMEKGKRAGAASGFSILPHCTSCYDPSSLSTATHNDRELVRGPKQMSTACTVQCTNSEGRRIEDFQVHGDMNMSRFCKAKKKLAALGSASYRKILILEMTSRIRVLSLTMMLKLTRRPDVEVKCIWHRIIMAINNVNSKSDSSNEWKRVDGMLSHWEIIMLEWATSTGEMRNHEACHAHEDGNKSHFLETMWLGGKSDAKDKTTSTTKVKGMTNGKLVLPIQGVVFDIRCGSDLLHLCLKNTMHHAPDETRDRCNFSRVHGP